MYLYDCAGVIGTILMDDEGSVFDDIMTRDIVRDRVVLGNWA